MQQLTHNASQDEIVGQLVEVLFTWGGGGADTTKRLWQVFSTRGEYIAA